MASKAIRRKHKQHDRENCISFGKVIKDVINLQRVDEQVLTNSVLMVLQPLKGRE